MGQVYTQSFDGEMVNLGMYSLQVYDKNHLGMHLQIHKVSSHFFEQYQKESKKNIPRDNASIVLITIEPVVV